MSLHTPGSNHVPPPPEPNFHAVTSAPLTPAQQIALSECTWAAGHPDIQMACYLGRICTNAPPKCCRYKAVPSIIQAGPTCGLTALSMLLNGQPSPEEILNLAKERHFTHIGEMFSAHNFFELVREVLARQSAAAVQCHLYQGRLNCAKVKDRLTSGACIFVPYPFQSNLALEEAMTWRAVQCFGSPEVNSQMSVRWGSYGNPADFDK